MMRLVRIPMAMANGIPTKMPSRPPTTISVMPGGYPVLEVATGQGVTLREHDDGHLEVLDAPPVAEFACSLLARPSPAIGVDEAGYLVLAGEVVYRPVGLRSHLSGQLLVVCERIR
jgi:hypothetical protein